MTVKTISTAYAGSYAFTPPTTELIVSATGSVAKGVSAGGTGTYTLINRGEVLNSGSTAAFCAVSFAGAGVVTNTGTIRSSTAGQGAGVVLAKDGRIANGSASDTTALIAGGLVGAELSAAGTVSNFATIEGSSSIGGAGVSLLSGGVLNNGSATDHAALIRGFMGVDTAAKVTNFGTIEGGATTGAWGVYMDGGSLTEEAGSVIEGYSGLKMQGATATVFGDITPGSGNAVGLYGASRLDLEAGSTISGNVVVNGTGVIDVVSGVATVKAISTRRAVIGAGTLNLADGYLGIGAALDCAVVHQTASTGKLAVYANVVDSHHWYQDAGATLYVGAGDKMSFTSVRNSFAGTVSGAGALGLNAGYDTLSNATLSVAQTSIGASTTVTMIGAIDIAGAVTSASHIVRIGASGVTLTGGGVVTLTGASQFYGFSSAPTFTNEDTIRGGGQLNSLVLVNLGTIDASSATPLALDAYAAMTNSGLAEATGAGHLTITGTVKNMGTLESAGGTLEVTGAVTGVGTIRVAGGLADIAGALGVGEAVIFGTSGRLELSDSVGFTSHVSGFSHSGTTSFDLEDIAFSGAKATYSGTTASGILTVTSGAHTARIHLTGNYTTATWALNNDGSGGTVVVDPTAPSPAAQAIRFTTASAGFGAGGATGERLLAAPQLHPPLLAWPGSTAHLV